MKFSGMRVAMVMLLVISVGSSCILAVDEGQTDSGEIHGLVRDLSGREVTGVTLTISPPKGAVPFVTTAIPGRVPGHHRSEVTTDSTGRFIAVGPFGRWNITVASPAGFSTAPSQPNPISVEVRRGESKHVVIEMSRLGN